MATAQEYSIEELNYFRVCSITTRIITSGLRVVFKQLWDTLYQATHGPWVDNAKNGMDLYGMESPRSRNRNSRELAILRNGNTNDWDCTCLFFAILYSDSVGGARGLDPVVRKSVDNLRQFRNKVFAHISDGKITDFDFQTSIQNVIAAFSALKLDTADIKVMKNQKTFPTVELRVTRQHLEKEKMRNEEPRSFCVLPPKPSHEVIDRSAKITEILKEMKRLRNTKKNEITVVYLSGNPGCGKSEIARQIGEKVFNDVLNSEEDQVKFIFTLNASSKEILIQSYVEFAISLSCDETSATSTGTSKDLSQEDKLIYLKSLVAPKLRKYSSWLLIVDNVTDVQSVFRYLPQAGEKTEGKGQILVTTQDSRSIGANDSYTYHLSLSRGLKPDDGVKTLSEISGIAANKEDILQIAKALDFQPLALACAATYMKRVRCTKPSISWDEYLRKLQQGKREVTEGVYERINVAYSQPMTAAVKLALEKEISQDMVMKHAFQFLSVVAPERIPLEYVVQYIKRRLPELDEDLVATTVFSSSLILSSEDQSKEIGVHQVVHSCLQYIVLHKSKEEEFYFLVNVINAFSKLLNAFDRNNVNDIISTILVAEHFMHLSKKLVLYTQNSLSPIILKKHFRKEYQESMSCITAAGHICRVHSKYETTNTLYKIVLMMKENFYHRNHPALGSPLNDLGMSLRSLGKHEEAKKCLERALAIDKKVYDENHPLLATTLNNLGMSLRSLGKHEEANKRLERALAIDEKVYDENQPELATTLNNLGLSLHSQGKHEEAKKCLERALAIQEKVYDKNYPELATTLNNLGMSLRSLGKHEEGMKCLERALAIQEKVYDENHLQLAPTLNNLGLSLHSQGKHKEAKKCLERALVIQEKAYDENHPNLATTLNNLALSLRDLGKHEEANKYLERTLAIQKKVYDENNPELATTLNNLGMSLRSLGQHEEAKKCLERALAIQEKMHDEIHPQLATTLNNLGMSLRSLGKHEEAKKCLERALATQEKVYDENHPQLATTLNNLGMSLRSLGKHKEAKKCLERALAIREKMYDENHTLLATSLNNLGLSLRDLGKHEEAKKCLERALAIQEKVYDENQPELATTLNNLGLSLRDLGQLEEAKKCLERALAIDEKVYDENHPLLATTLNNLGMSLHSLGKHAEANECLERALAIDEKVYDENHPLLAITLNNLGLILRALGKHEEAKKCLERALAIQEKVDDFHHTSHRQPNLSFCLYL